MVKFKQKIKNKKAQEEMFGFAIIIVVVAVVVLLLLFFSINSEEDYYRSYKGNSFIQSILDYTTTCQKYTGGEYLNIEELIYSCVEKETCTNGEKSCEVLNSTLNDMINKTWPAGKEWPTKGYEFYISSNEKHDVYYFKKGSKKNATIIKKSSQYLSRGSLKVNITFTIYEKSNP